MLFRSDEKLGQMVQAEQNGLELFEVTQYGIGSVLSGGGSAPEYGNTAEDWNKRVNELRKAAADTRLGIPLLYGIDAVHGNNNVADAVIFPHNIGLGAANDPELMERIGTVVAKEVLAIGVKLTFAPTVGVPMNERWGRTYECFSEDYDRVTELASAYVVGMQGKIDTEEYLSKEKIMTTAKHYIGEGLTENGVNQGNVVMQDVMFNKLLQEELLKPYRELIKEGTLVVMASYNSINGLKCHENKYLLTTVLKEELGFQGFVIGDYNGVQQVVGDTYKDKICNALNAGIDMFMEPYDWKTVITSLKEGIKDGSVSLERIDDAVSRILRAKFVAGLFDNISLATFEEELLRCFGSEQHRAIAREAVSKSLVLLKNNVIKDGESAINVLAKASNITVAGSKANDIGTQCGGWSITWEGASGDITTGTTIVKGFQEVAANNEEEKNINYSKDGELIGNEEAVVVVVGENPYVEGYGDRKENQLVLYQSDIALIKKIKKEVTPGIPIIVILISGRPINVTSILEETDALVAAWLPGTEGSL